MLRKQFCIMALVLMSASLAAEEPLYSIGPKAGFASMVGGDSTSFTPEFAYGGELQYAIGGNWALVADYLRYELTDDDDWMKYRSNGFGLVLQKRLFRLGEQSRLEVGLGGGVLYWKALDPSEDTLLDAYGVNNAPRDFKASEIFLRARAAITFPLTDLLRGSLSLQYDHLTTAGADFASEVNDSRERGLWGAFLSLTAGFGRADQPRRWRTEQTWPTQTTPPAVSSETGVIDGDRDGVPDDEDECLNSPRGALVDRDGCPIDSDGDGVVDGLDDCPATDPAARGKVDVFGCPVDSDFDGLPDYLDACPNNQAGAEVDSTGCPIDSDADGIPNGIDDCPNTLYGLDVDSRGCIDLSMLAEPMVLHIDYAPGSFEIDPNNQERVRQLARLLLFVKEIKLEINGYTDNIGTTAANQKLSEKRANRVRDFLVAQGIDSARIKVFGRGETNFIAPNATAEGRKQNRRVEIVFYR